MEKFINTKANEMIEDLRKKMRDRGAELTPEAEYYIRVGMGYGINLSSLGLAKLPVNVTLVQELGEK